MAGHPPSAVHPVAKAGRNWCKNDYISLKAAMARIALRRRVA
jgi:hypothetical protein